jgi:flagellar hook-length control protein FliK
LKVSPPSTDQKNGQAGEESLAKGEAPRQVSKKAASQIAYSSDQVTFPAEIQAGGSKGSVQSGKPDLSVIQQVIDKIQEAVQEGHPSLRMQLNPKNLGAIDLRLVSNGQSVSITMIAEQPGTGQLLEKQMDQLRANLAGAGINLANVNIGHQAANGQQGGGFTREPTPERFMEGGRNTAESQLESGSSPYTNRAKTDSRIDYRI